MNAQEQAYPFRDTLFARMAIAGAHWAGAGPSRGTSQDRSAFNECSRAEAGVAATAGTAAPSAGPDHAPVLAKGQLWKLPGAYVEIVALDQKLIHYRVVRQRGQKTLTRVLKREAFEGCLGESGAVLTD